MTTPEKGEGLHALSEKIRDHLDRQFCGDPCVSAPCRCSDELAELAAHHLNQGKE